MERTTYRATAWQAGVLLGLFTLAVVWPQLLGPTTWDRGMVTVLVVGLLVILLLVVRQGLRIDDRGVTVLRGLFHRRVPWDEVTGVEPAVTGLGRRYLVVTTTRTVHVVPFPTDGRLLRDDGFGRKTRRIQERVARELERRVPVG